MTMTLADDVRILALALAVTSSVTLPGTRRASDLRPSASSARVAGSVVLVPTGHSVRTVAADDALVASTVAELDEGATDLNGDGDADDVVLFITDAVSGRTRNLGLAAESVEVAAPHVIFTVPEIDEGNDLNGDGDLSDRILHVLDTSRDLLTNTGLDIAYQFTFGGARMQIQDGVVAVLGRTASTFTVQFVELSSGDVLDTQVPMTPFRDFGPSSTYGVVVSELFAGADLNGDGDLADGAVQLIDVPTGLVTNLGVASTASSGLPKWSLGDELLAIGVSEFVNGGVDLDGDGLPFSSVLHLYDYATGSLTNTGIALGTDQPEPIGRRVAYRAPSTELRVFDADTGAVLEGPGPVLSLGIVDAGVLFDVAESGAGDLNGDGDTKDRILHALELETGSVTNFGAGGEAIFELGRAAIAHAFETSDGKDYNGDGDMRDAVHFQWSVPQGLELLGIEGTLLGSLGRGALVTQVFEAGTDLNGDGDTGDRVAFVGRAAAGAAPINLGLALEGAYLPRREQTRVFPLRVDENAQGRTDLNGDGDTDDVVLVILRAF